jgi:hypothetical protein
MFFKRNTSYKLVRSVFFSFLSLFQIKNILFLTQEKNKIFFAKRLFISVFFVEILDFF